MNPVELAFDAQARLVAVEDLRGRQERLDLRLEACEVVIGRGLGVLAGLFADAVAVDVGAELADAIRGDELPVAQIGQEAEEAFPVLYGGRDQGREGCAYIGVTSGAMFCFCTILGDLEFLGRQVEDLAALMVD